MFIQRILPIAVAVLACNAFAAAQITPIPPFIGQSSESFETQTPMVLSTCLQGRVFQNQGDLCATFGAFAHVVPSSTNQCTVFPHTGNFLAEAIAGPLEFKFDRPATRFGGYFASYTAVPSVLVTIYGPCHVQLAQFSVPPAPNCNWTWYGWQSGVLPIESVTVETLTGLGSHVQLDSFEADFTVPFPAPFVYCTAKVNSLGCTPAISFAGKPSFCCGHGFKVVCTQVRNNKSGLLFYTNSGPLAVPFQGGTLCLKSPIRRTPAQNSGGTPPPANDCSGVFAIDLNSFALGTLGGSPAPYLLIPGTTINVQWWGRDPGFPVPNNTTLSDAVQYVIGWGC